MMISESQIKTIVSRELVFPGDDPDPFSDNDENCDWTAATRKNIQRSYRCWIRWLADEEPDILACPPETRLTLEIVERYCEGLQSRGLAPSTVGAYLYDLSIAYRDLLGVDSGWLHRAGIWKRRRAQGDSYFPTVNSRHLMAVGLRLCRSAIQQGVSKGSALVFRNGLVLAIASCRPLRPRNMIGLKIGETLIEEGARWRIKFGMASMKTNFEVDFGLPTSVGRLIRRYLDDYRCAIPRANAHSYLFPSMRGTGISYCSLHRVISGITEAEFGFRISPHKIRHCVATSIAEEIPENVGITRSLLGHRRLETSQRYYNRAEQASAQMLYLASPAELQG